MPSGIPTEPPTPWREFLRELDAALPGPVVLHCLGGFIVSVLYGLPRPTNDLDYTDVVPPAAQARLLELAGRGSSLASRHRLFLQHVSVASLPDGYVERLVPLFPGRYQHLELHALEAHDLALSKLSRNSPVDREDIAFLARTVPLDADVLRARYRQELRPIAIGPLERLDEVLELWIEAYFRTP